MDCRSFSIEHLLRITFQHGLITDYRITPGKVVLFQQDEEIISCDPEEARIYLQGMLTGQVFAEKEAGGAGKSPLVDPPPLGRDGEIEA